MKLNVRDISNINVIRMKYRAALTNIVKPKSK